MLADTTLQLQREFENIVAIKESSGNLSQIMEIIRLRRAGFKVYSGDDNLALAISAHGGDGVISVVANETPDVMNHSPKAVFKGRLMSLKGFTTSYYH